MFRYSKRDNKGNACLRISVGEDKGKYCRPMKKTNNGYESLMSEAFNQLALYEETGLTPQEIEQLKLERMGSNGG